MRAGLRSEFRADMTALEERINRKLYALLGVLALLITIYEFIG
jgi:hypothetical protein